MIKLNKKSKRKSVESKPLPPTHDVFKLEVNHNCSIEVTREQAKALKDRELAFDHKEKLVKNYDGVGCHRLSVLRISIYLYNKCTVYRTATGILIRKLTEFLDPLIEWRYRSCLAILMGRL